MRLNAVMRRQGLQVRCINPSPNPHPATDAFLYQIFANNSSELTPCTKCQLVPEKWVQFYGPRCQSKAPQHTSLILFTTTEMSPDQNGRR